ncbi:MAG: divergent PAP2 family protein [bacterium]|nr:MAG: divergent PAP2 family protein [bacterium]
MFRQYLYKHIFLVPIICGAFIQCMKVLLYSFLDKRIAIGRFFQTGGLPNLHSAVFSSLSAGIGIKYGYSSILFSLVTTYSAMIVYDTMRLKGEKRKQVDVLNKILSSLDGSGAIERDQRLRVLHYRPLDVMSGVLLGLAGAFILM